MAQGDAGNWTNNPSAAEHENDANAKRVIMIGTDPNGLPTYLKITPDGDIIVPVNDTPEFFEDTDFAVGDSPFIADINAALGRNGTKGTLMNDGCGSFSVEFSTDGVAYGDAITVKAFEVMEFESISVDSLRITHLGVDSAYRLVAI